MKILILGAYDRLVAALRAKGHEAYTCFFSSLVTNYDSSLRTSHYSKWVESPQKREWHIDAEPFDWSLDKRLLDGGCFKTSAGAEHWVDKWDVILIPDYFLEKYIKECIQNQKSRDNVFIIPDSNKVEEVLKELIQ